MTLEEIVMLLAPMVTMPWELTLPEEPPGPISELRIVTLATSVSTPQGPEGVVAGGGGGGRGQAWEAARVLERARASESALEPAQASESARVLAPAQALE